MSGRSVPVRGRIQPTSHRFDRNHAIGRYPKRSLNPLCPIAPFFLDIGLPRQALVGTKAACQSLGHVAKLIVFGVAGFAYLAYLPLLALLSAMVVVGTWVGSRILDRVSERAFLVAYRAVLTLIALRLVLGEGWRMVGG
jgi:uncharacterized membrane protein YfcA